MKVAERHTGHEGWVQSHWSRVSGPWTHFDREAVLGCVSPEGPNRAREYDYVLAALAELSGRNDWSRRLPRAGGGRSEVDQLAVDTEGRLVLIELKSTSGGADGIYCSPLQLLGYLCEWHAAPGAVLGDVQALIDARIELRLTVGPAPRLSGGLRGVIGFGRDTRSKRLKLLYETVLSVVNGHLPDDIPPIETWALDEGQKPVLVESC